MTHVTIRWIRLKRRAWASTDGVRCLPDSSPASTGPVRLVPFEGVVEDHPLERQLSDLTVTYDMSPAVRADIDRLRSAADSLGVVDPADRWSRSGRCTSSSWRR